MSHQDRKSQQQIVVNHQVLREVIAWLLPPALFVGMHVRQGSRWKPRMLAAAALFWATSDHTTLTDRFGHTRKIIKRIFRGQPEPGKTYRGFMKMLDKWHVRLLLKVVSGLRLRWNKNFKNSTKSPDSRCSRETAVACRPRGQSQTNGRIPRSENRNATRKRNRSVANPNRRANARHKPPDAEKRRNNLQPRSRRKPT